MWRKILPYDFTPSTANIPIPAELVSDQVNGLEKLVLSEGVSGVRSWMEGMETGKVAVPTRRGWRRS
jgi:hypothetical protein